MKNLLLAILICLACSGLAQAHSLHLEVSDNGDGTMLIRGAFSTGETAAGAMVRLVARSSGTVLTELRLPTLGEIELPIPAEPYDIVLDGGPGHGVRKAGIAPPGGFSPGTAPHASSFPPQPQYVLWTLALVLFSLTAVVGWRTQRRIARAADCI